MKALVSYAYENWSDRAKSPIGISNDVEYFEDDVPTLKEICEFERQHECFPSRVNVNVIGIVKLHETKKE